MQSSLKKYFPIFVLPTLLAFLIAFLVPFVIGFVLSFADFTTITDASFVGLDNYKQAFTQREGFIDSFVFTTLVVIVSIVTVIDRATKRVVTGPDIHARGIAEDDSVFDEITPKITAALEDALRRAPQKVHTTQQLQQIVRRTLGAWVSRRLRRKPMIVPVVVEHKSGPEAAK